MLAALDAHARLLLAWTALDQPHVRPRSRTPGRGPRPRQPLRRAPGAPLDRPRGRGSPTSAAAAATPACPWPSCCPPRARSSSSRSARRRASSRWPRRPSAAGPWSGRRDAGAGGGAAPGGGAGRSGRPAGHLRPGHGAGRGIAGASRRRSACPCCGPEACWSPGSATAATARSTQRWMRHGPRSPAWAAPPRGSSASACRRGSPGSRGIVSCWSQAGPAGAAASRREPPARLTRCASRCSRTSMPT